jgi:hypothetical protein
MWQQEHDMLAADDCSTDQGKTRSLPSNCLLFFADDDAEGGYSSWYQEETVRFEIESVPLAMKPSEGSGYQLCVPVTCT